MKNALLHSFIICTTVLAGCNEPAESTDTGDVRSEILAVENEFERMTREEGMASAFYHFADENAVLQRGNRLVEGKEAIRDWFETETYQDIDLQWEPDFIDVSESGDLAYTYGKYVFTARDTAGEMVTSEGIFHTVWKRQDDGTWKYVWD